MVAEAEEIPKYDLSQFKLLYPIGRGAKGAVFRARIAGLSDDLALKLVVKSSIKKKRSNGGGEECCSKVRFEEQVLKEFDHPLLPKLKGVVETQHLVGYAIQYCPGGDLNSFRKLQVEKMFSDDIIRFFAAELVLALEYLHDKGIVYRDLKPENVLIQENGHLMLVDFDLSTKLAPRSFKTRPSYDSVKKIPVSPNRKKKTQLPKFYRLCKSGIFPHDLVEEQDKSTESTQSELGSSESDSVIGKSNSFVGTEEYVAPEIIQSTGHDFSVDWWCLGVVLYEMLYGQTPFKGENRKETFYRILTKSPDLVGETTPLRDLIRRLLEKDPEKRITLEEIKGHDFFKGVDWEMILRLSRPPFIPLRTQIEEDLDGIKAQDLESMVYAIFNNNNNNNNNNNDDDFFVF